MRSAAVPAAVAEAVGLSSADTAGQPALAGTGVLERLHAVLADRTALVVLDNCEHVIDDAARLDVDVLASAPRLRLLATSREALRVPGEMVWRVPPLGTAAAGDGELAATLLGTAEQLRTTAGSQLHGHERTDLERAERRTRDQLGEDAYVKAHEAGRAGDLDTVLARVVTDEERVALDSLPETSRVGPPVGRSGQLVEQLGERELMVLRRLPSSLSNQEIAGLLYVSLNTVKTHIQSIYRKLGVNSRHEAIERARQLDLL